MNELNNLGFVLQGRLENEHSNNILTPCERPFSLKCSTLLASDAANTRDVHDASLKTINLLMIYQPLETLRLFRLYRGKSAEAISTFAFAVSWPC